MNLLYLKYAVEVAGCGSINKAAEKLNIDQPNLSRSIRDLEASLGVTIFERSARGMKLTPNGEQFLKYAENILKQVDTVENMFRNGGSNKKRFSISVPLASYTASAFSEFSKKMPSDTPYEIVYKETNTPGAIANILNESYCLGIIRYAEKYDSYYRDMLESKGLTYELLARFSYVVVANRNSPLASLDSVTFDALQNLVEIVHADTSAPSLPLSEVKKEETPEIDKRIFIFDRASQYELLANNENTFMWVSPIPQDMLDRYGLVQKECPQNRKKYMDYLIYKNDYKLTDIDVSFINEICRVNKALFGEDAELS